MRRETKLTAIMLVALLAAVLAYARPAAAQETKSDKEKIQANIAALNDPETTDAARLLAAGYLIDVAAKHPDALAALKTALDYAHVPPPTPKVVFAVLNALTNKTEAVPSELVDMVINRLGDKDANIAERAEAALTTKESRKTDQIYLSLVKVLKNETRPENIRARAAGIIAESDRPTACDDLIKALGTGGLSEASIVKIIRALGKIGDKQAVPMLMNKLDDKSAAIRRSAAQSLRSITFYDLGEDKAAWEKWWAQNKQKNTRTVAGGIRPRTAKGPRRRNDRRPQGRHAGYRAQHGSEGLPRACREDHYAPRPIRCAIRRGNKKYG